MPASVAALEDGVHGTHGLLKAPQPGSTVIELSTYPLQVKLRLADTLRAAACASLESGSAAIDHCSSFFASAATCAAVGK